LTSEIVYYNFRGFFEVDKQSGEYIIAPLGPWDFVKAKANEMLTPYCHQSAGEGLLFVS
jgi:hypothetical protein